MKIGTRCANFVYSRTLSDARCPHFSCSQSIPFLILSIWTKKQENSIPEKLHWNDSLFLLSRERRFFWMLTGKAITYSFSSGLFYLKERHQLQTSNWYTYLCWIEYIYLIYNFTNVASYMADSWKLTSSWKKENLKNGWSSTRVISKRNMVTLIFVLSFWQKLIFALLHGKFLKICRWEHFEHWRMSLTICLFVLFVSFFFFKRLFPNWSYVMKSEKNSTYYKNSNWSPFGRVNSFYLHLKLQGWKLHGYTSQLKYVFRLEENVSRVIRQDSLVLGFTLEAKLSFK